jgi:hypothetical protein
VRGFHGGITANPQLDRIRGKEGGGIRRGSVYREDGSRYHGALDPGDTGRTDHREVLVVASRPSALHMCTPANATPRSKEPVFSVVAAFAR